MIDARNNTIKQALIEINMREFEAMGKLPRYEGELSEGYKERIEAIMNRGNALRARFGRIFIIAAIIAALLLASCSVSGFVIRRVDNGRGTDFYTNGDGMKKSFEEFYIIDVPQGFTYDYVYNLSKAQSYVLSNEKKEIIFGQYLAENRSIKLNTEYNGYEKIKIGDYEIFHTLNKGWYTGIWLYDGYTFALTVKGGLGYDDFVSIIESIHIAEPGEIEAIRVPERTEYSTVVYE